MEDDQPRSIRFPKQLWKVIDEDAKRCKRSSVKQLEAILAGYYGLADTRINRERLQLIGELSGKSNKPMEVLESEHEQRKTA
jgi:hypothetical protein